MFAMETILGLKFNETTPECTKEGDIGICNTQCIVDSIFP